MSSLNDCQNKLIIRIMKILFPLSSPGEKACYWLYLYWYNPQALYCKYAVLLNLSNSVWNNVGDWLADVWLVGHNLFQLSINPHPSSLLCKLLLWHFAFCTFPPGLPSPVPERDPFLPNTGPTHYRAPKGIFSCTSFSWALLSFSKHDEVAPMSHIN